MGWCPLVRVPRSPGRLAGAGARGSVHRGRSRGAVWTWGTSALSGSRAVPPLGASCAGHRGRRRSRRFAVVPACALAGGGRQWGPGPVPVGVRDVLVARRGRVPGVSAQLRRLQRRRVGDLAGVLSRLDHLCWLGVDALWLCPFYPSPWVDGGYDVTDHRQVHPRLGTLRTSTGWWPPRTGGPAGAGRHRAEPHLRRTPVVPRGAAGRTGVTAAAALHLPPRPGPGATAEQLGVPVRRPRLDPGAGQPGTCTCSPNSSRT